MFEDFPEGDALPEDHIDGAVKPKKKKAQAKKPAAKKKAPVKKAAAKKAPKGERKAREPKAGVGAFIRGLVKENKWTHAQIVDKAKKAFPDSDTDTKDVTWQKWAMKTGRVK